MRTKFRARSDLGWIWSITGVLWLLNALIRSSNGFTDTIELWTFILSLSTALISFLDAYMFFSKKNYMQITKIEIIRSFPLRKPKVIPVSNLVSANIVKKGIGSFIFIETKGKPLRIPRGYYDATPSDIVKSIQAVLPSFKTESIISNETTL